MAERSTISGEKDIKNIIKFEKKDMKFPSHSGLPALIYASSLVTFFAYYVIYILIETIAKVECGNMVIQ